MVWWETQHALASQTEFGLDQYLPVLVSACVKDSKHNACSHFNEISPAWIFGMDINNFTNENNAQGF